MGKKRLIIMVFMVIILVEVALVMNVLLTIKYNIEPLDNLSQILNEVYSLANYLILIVVFNIIYLFVLHVLLFKSCDKVGINQ